MQYWLLKTEPEAWSWDHQVKRGDAGEIWDGVRNYQAASSLKKMRPGDRAFFYHSGKSRSIVGVVEITEGAFPDPTDPDGKFVAVRVRALRALPAPVTLAQMKSDPALADLPLLRQSRLSVVPLTAAQWRRIETMAAK
jgi:predicted RNA-binding protein with PUA-like domain